MNSIIKFLSVFSWSSTFNFYWSHNHHILSFNIIFDIEMTSSWLCYFSAHIVEASIYWQTCVVVRHQRLAGGLVLFSANINVALSFNFRSAISPCIDKFCFETLKYKFVACARISHRLRVTANVTKRNNEKIGIWHFRWTSIWIYFVQIQRRTNL